MNNVEQLRSKIGDERYLAALADSFAYWGMEYNPTPNNLTELGRINRDALDLEGAIATDEAIEKGLLSEGKLTAGELKAGTQAYMGQVLTDTMRHIADLEAEAGEVE